MKFKFIGDYTNGHTQVDFGGVTFVGREPAEVTDEKIVARLQRHPEVEEVPDEAPKGGAKAA